MRLDHDTGDVGLACDELLADVGEDLGLVAVVFGRVAVCKTTSLLAMM